MSAKYNSIYYFYVSKFWTNAKKLKTCDTNCFVWANWSSMFINSKLNRDKPPVLSFDDFSLLRIGTTLFILYVIEFLKTLGLCILTLFRKKLNQWKMINEYPAITLVTQIIKKSRFQLHYYFISFAHHLISCHLFNNPLVEPIRYEFSCI